MVIRVSDKKKNYSKVTKLLVKPNRFQNILNKNKGQQAIHDYYNRDEYRSDFERLWNSLKSMGLADHTLHKIENENILA